jgi:hypothetical protein
VKGWEWDKRNRDDESLKSRICTCMEVRGCWKRFASDSSREKPPKQRVEKRILTLGYEWDPRRTPFQIERDVNGRWKTGGIVLLG